MNSKHQIAVTAVTYDNNQSVNPNRKYLLKFNFSSNYANFRQNKL